MNKKRMKQLVASALEHSEKAKVLRRKVEWDVITLLAKRKL